MGLLCDYFTAPGDSAAAETIDWIGGPGKPPPARGLLRRRPEREGFPTLSYTGLEPTMWMAKLEEVVTGREFDEILQDPTGQVITSRDEGERVVVSLTDNLQQALIELDDERIDEVAAAWGQHDDDYELEADPDDAAAVLRELIGLLRAGKAQGQRGYCWVCV